ncbi:MAG: hypothetical protein K8S54_07475 [Spirochaetia bacterium]|nr:hypothetical protein [Spirochaetia bacterium]
MLPEETSQPFTPGLEELAVVSMPGEAPEPDLVSDLELRNLMIQYSPVYLKDVGLIEAGVDSFFLFHETPEALVHTQKLEMLKAKELKLLEEKGAIRLYHYINLSEDRAKLSLVEVAIRPASQKGYLVTQVKRGCIRGSAYSVMRHLLYRAEILRQLEAKGELAAWMRKRIVGEITGPMRTFSESQIKRLPGAFKVLSLDYFLSQEIQKPDLETAVITILSRKPGSGGTFEDGVPTPDDIRTSLIARSNRPVLTTLSENFHLMLPAVLSDVANSNSGKFKTELDYILELYSEALRAILIVGMGEEASRVEYAESEELLRLISIHPSFQHPELWPRGAEFLTEFRNLAASAQDLIKLRREIVIVSIIERVFKLMSMRFEPMLFEPLAAISSLPEEMRGLFPDTNAASTAIVDRLKTHPELFCFTERRGPAGDIQFYTIFKSNVPGAFIRNPQRRSFYHVLAKDNKMPRGIYDFLRSVSPGDPQKLVEEQLALARSIRDWEEEQEKERIKKEKKERGLWGRLVDFVLSLFGISRYARRSDDTIATSGREVIKGNAKIPSRIQKAIDYVERNNRGLIWMDELMPYLNRTEQSESEIAEMLLGDSEGRYTEVEPLHNTRRLFLRYANLDKPDWRRNTLDILEHRFSPGPEIRALIEYLTTSPGA